jgi:hypothetical protein
MKTLDAALLLVLAAPAGSVAGQAEDDLLDAIRKGDAAAVKVLLDQGVGVDTKYRYDRTPLSFAADRGHLEIVTLLLERGADAGAKDTFYGTTPMNWAAIKGHTDVVLALLPRSGSAAAALMAAARGNHPQTAEAILATGQVSARDQSYVLEAAERGEDKRVAERLRARGAVPPPPADKTIDPAVLARYAGRYRSEQDAKDEFTLKTTEAGLSGDFEGRTFKLGAIDAQNFRVEGTALTLEMRVEGERTTGAVATDIGSQKRYARVEAAQP